MERQTFKAVFILALLILAVEGSLLANPASANFGPITIPLLPIVHVTVSSPKNNTEYHTNNVDFKFGATIQSGSGHHVECYLDGKCLKTFVTAMDSFSVTLPELSNGLHYVEVTAQASYIAYPTTAFRQITDYCKVYFSVNAPVVPPQVIVVSMQNQTFQTANAAFNFTVNKPATWLAYSLDQNDNVTITQTAALTRPYGVDNYYQTIITQTDGAHTIAFYAKDTLGNIGKSNTISFTTNTQPEPSPSPTPPPSKPSSPTATDPPTPQPTITPSTTPNPTFSPIPSPSPTPATSASDTPSPTPTDLGEPFGIYWVAAALVAFIVSTTVLATILLKRKRQRNCCHL